MHIIDNSTDTLYARQVFDLLLTSYIVLCRSVVSGGVRGNQGDVAGIAGGVVGALVAVGVILVVVLLVAVLIYWKYQRTYSVGEKSLHVTAQSPPKMVSVETTVSYGGGTGASPPMGGGYRESVCIRTSVFLPTEHESEEQLET